MMANDAVQHEASDQDTSPDVEHSEPPVAADVPVGATIAGARQPVFGQGIVVSLLAAAFLLVLAIMAVREDETVTGVPATETTGPLFWGLSIIFTVAIGLGAQFTEMSAASAADALGQPRTQRGYPTAWIVPVVGMAGAILLVATMHNSAMFVIGPLCAAFAVGGSLLARDLLDDATESTYRTASAVHTVVIHVVALVSLAAVYMNKMSLLAAIPLIIVFSFFLLFEAMERGNAPLGLRVTYSLLGAYVIGQAAVFLDWWQTYGLTGGGVLLVCFYLVAGVLVTQTRRGEVRSRDLLEFGLVGAIAMAILIVTM